MRVWVVGWSQDLDDWGVYGVYAEPEKAESVAEAAQRSRHDFIRHSRVTKRELARFMDEHGLSGSQPPFGQPDPGKGCCKPQIAESEFIA